MPEDMTEFERDISDAEFEAGVPRGTIQKDAAHSMAREFGRLLAKKIAYRKARELALLGWVPLNAYQNGWDAYKGLLDRCAQRWAKKARERKAQMAARPFAPLEAYQDDPH